jgi:hypothetical protein
LPYSENSSPERSPGQRHRDRIQKIVNNFSGFIIMSEEFKGVRKGKKEEGGKGEEGN